MKKYILGLITGLFIIPIIEEISNVLFSWIEVAKIKSASIIASCNREASGNDLEQYETPVVGFQINTTNDDYDED